MKTGSRTGYIWAVLACVLTTALVLPLRGTFAETNLAMVYLLEVVFVTVRLGRGPGILASVLAVLAFDVFLVPPYYSVSVADTEYLLTFAIMLVVSLVVSHLTANLGYQAAASRRGERRASALFELSRDLSGAQSAGQIAEVGMRHLGTTFNARAVFLFPDAAASVKLAPAGIGKGEAPRLGEEVLRIAQLVFERKAAATYEEGAVASAGIRYLPLRAPLGTRGVLVLIAADAGQRLVPEQEQLLQTFAAQIALAIERVHYVEVAQGALVAIESERLRNSILSAISHDIRTPLTTIVGLSSTLADERGLAPAISRELAQAIHDDALRMNSMVTNLLDMAKLHAGPVTLNRQWQMLEEVVGSALAQLARSLAGMRVDVSLPASLPLLAFDAVLLERVFCNLLDNAAKYAAAGGSVSIAAEVVDGQVQVAVEDRGPGIEPGAEDAIFTSFSRGASAAAPGGVGLGLAICRAIVEAHGGAIRAEGRPGGGARFVFVLPLESAVPPEGLYEADECQRELET